MSKIRRYVLQNWVWIFLSFIFMRKVMEFCCTQRGSFQIGGEIFILPMVLIAIYFAGNDGER